MGWLYSSIATCDGSGYGVTTTVTGSGRDPRPRRGGRAVCSNGCAAGAALARSCDPMRPCVLVAVPEGSRSWVVDALRARCEVKASSNPRQARAVLAAGCFQAVVTMDGFLDPSGAPDDSISLVVIPDDRDAQTLLSLDERAIANRRRREREQASAVPELALLTHREFTDLARYRATRQYLLALVRVHDGSVTESARAAGLERESLHRLLRRYNVHADDFRDPARGDRG
jgi:hypothetical protein